jgi:hypothetical protein
MSLPRANRLALAASFGAALLFFGALLAPAAMSQPASLNPGTAAAAMPLPPSPPLKSPVDFFRELLAMNLAERKQSLADRNPEDQKRILAKVREYESLKPDQRELRLRATELRWYLLPLMTSPPTNRPAQLALIPADPRKLVEDRLGLWDKLPAAVQKELLENEATLQYITPLESASEEQRKEILKTISPARRERLEAGIARWRESSETQRQETLSRFNQFFDLTPWEKDRALNTISEAERRQMERTLRAFENLPKAQRARCIQSFEKFAGMSLEERQQFLKNAERWRLMRPEERQAWRDLVLRLPELPPSPPGLGLPPPPPGPPGLDQPVVTNRN